MKCSILICGIVQNSSAICWKMTSQFISDALPFCKFTCGPFQWVLMWYLCSSNTRNWRLAWNGGIFLFHRSEDSSCAVSTTLAVCGWSASSIDCSRGTRGQGLRELLCLTFSTPSSPYLYHHRYSDGCPFYDGTVFCFPIDYTLKCYWNLHLVQCWVSSCTASVLLQMLLMSVLRVTDQCAPARDAPKNPFLFDSAALSPFGKFCRFFFLWFHHRGGLLLGSTTAENCRSYVLEENGCI